MTALKYLQRPAWLTEQAWPWPVATLSTPAGSVAVTDAGNGPTLLLVHTGTWSFVWRDLLRELVAHYRCITVDAPGCGLSERLPTHVSLEAAATAVGTVIDELALHDITLVAHDLGGPVSIAAAADRPDHIAAIAAINCFGWRPEGAAFRGMLAAMGSAPVRASDVRLGWLPLATSGRFGVGRHWDTADRKVFRRGIDPPARRAWHGYFADARRADRLYTVVEAALRGPLASKPLLTVFGQHNDPLKFQPRWLSFFPRARQEIIPGGLHFPMCDNPRLVADILRDWLPAR